MSTTKDKGMKMTKPNYTITRATHKIDGTNQVVGRLATTVTNLLRGKHKVDFTPHVDNGDFVVVSNAKGLVMTGKKLDQKLYRRHSMYPGGLKEVKAGDLMKKDPKQLLEEAVWRMLQKNNTRTEIFKRLTVKN